jgi:hypothetical protein
MDVHGSNNLNTQAMRQWRKRGGRLATNVIAALINPALQEDLHKMKWGQQVKKYLFLASVVAVLCFALLLSFGTAQAAPVAQEGGDVEPAPLIIPFEEEWMNSGHADATTEAFRHWDEEDPAEIPVECAKCHSSTGYQDFLGVDGSAPDVVDSPHALGTVVDCVACHNDVTIVKDSVTMPSGLVLAGLGDESRCMECHQGRESKMSVDQAIADSGADLDAVSEDLGFRNIHYYAAAATKYGTLAKGGYEYDGKSYDANFTHVEGFETCIECHNSHTLEVKVAECQECHEDVEAVEDLRDVRMAGSETDYDGDGDVEEGIAFELEGLQETLFGAMQTYASEVAGTPIVYNSAAYPYFFVDTNANGTAEEDEAAFPNAFKAWTPRLLKAAYNYQTSLKDPGAYAHGGKYIVQLLFDSIEDLNGAIGEQVDMTAMRRIDSGHFAGSEEAFRHWDADGAVPGNCAKCHSSMGLPTFLSEGVSISQPPSNGLACATCHDDLVEFTRYEVQEVKFPSGAVIDSGDLDTNLCMQCHQGRESGVSVDRLIGDTEPDVQSESLRFLNPHYFAAGATRFGTEAKGAYEYEGKEYVGFFDHDPEANECSDCHGTHGLEVDWESCVECHSEVETAEDLQNIRYNLVDYDGDGDDAEGLYFEIDTMREALYPALQAYAAETVGTGIVYDGNSHPYFFVDTNGDGVADPEEVNGDNRFASWTPRLLRGAYNYQYSGKDPGAFTHNGAYIIQTLYDSLEDLGADVSGMTRP